MLKYSAKKTALNDAAQDTLSGAKHHPEFYKPYPILLVGNYFDNLMFALAIACPQS